MGVHQIVHLPEFEIIIGQQGDDLFFSLQRAFRPLEIETLGNLPAYAVDRVVDFL